MTELATRLESDVATKAIADAGFDRVLLTPGEPPVMRPAALDASSAVSSLPTALPPSLVQVRAINDEARRLVLWCGQANIDLVGALGVRRHRVSEVRLDLGAVSAHVAEARAIVIEVPDIVEDATAWAGPVVELALMHGLAVALCMASHHQNEEPSEVPADRVARFTRAVAGLRSRGDQRVRIELGRWSDLAEWIATRHQAGPAANTQLELHGDLPTDPAAVTLLQRACADLHAVTLTQINGGKSGAGVWLVEPSGRDAVRRALPFLMKYNTLDKTRAERSAYQLYADGRIPFNLRPPLHTSRCVEGASHGLLVFDFLERAVPFASALTAYTPGQLVGSLFGHTLAGCLRSVTETINLLTEPFESLKVLHWSAALREAADHARAAHDTLPDVDQLRTMLRSLPAVSHRVATAHGDLHTGNLFVGAGSSDVYLIDFGSIAYGMPVGTDAACLEVSVAFAPADVRGSLARGAPAADEVWLRAAYQFPLEPFAVPARAGRDRWLADTLRATRAADRQFETNPVPYAFAVASYLVRFASYADNGSVEDRALAYELACGLFCAVQRTLARESDRTLIAMPRETAEIET